MFGPRVPSVSVTEIHRRQKSGEEVLLLDVRGQDERDFASIGGLHIEMTGLPSRLEELEPFRDEEIVVYCRSGQRSAGVVRFLKANGFEKALNLDGGILAWSRQVDSSIRTY